jgi:hypothetical protein
VTGTLESDTPLVIRTCLAGPSGGSIETAPAAVLQATVLNRVEVCAPRKKPRA